MAKQLRVVIIHACFELLEVVEGEKVHEINEELWEKLLAETVLGMNLLESLRYVGHLVPEKVPRKIHRSLCVHLACHLLDQSRQIIAGRQRGHLVSSTIEATEELSPRNEEDVSDNLAPGKELLGQILQMRITRKSDQDIVRVGHSTVGRESREWVPISTRNENAARIGGRWGFAGTSECRFERPLVSLACAVRSLF